MTVTMRVLHIAKANGIGGSERHLFTLLPGLASRGVEVTICVLEEGQSWRFVDPLRDLGIDVVSLRAGPNENPMLIPALARQIRRIQPDLVHTHLLHADLYGLSAARWVGVPAVRSIHRTVGRRGYRSLERMVGPLASRTIAISEEVARFTREARVASLDRVRVVPYGIDASPFAMSDEERGLARQELGVGPDEVAVGIASRLVPGKGHTFLIDALAVAQPEAPPIRLRIAGDGPLRAELEQHARRLAPGVARFMGHVVDVSRFMAACDVLVFPTFPAFGEGFGLAALEALAAGCPVVATPVGSMPEMVVDGVTGLLVPPGDVPRLAGALVHLAGNPVLRRTLGANAARRARTDFGVEPMVDATLRIYEEVLSGHAGVAPRAPRPKTPMPGV